MKHTPRLSYGSPAFNSGVASLDPDLDTLSLIAGGIEYIRFTPDDETVMLVHEREQLCTFERAVSCINACAEIEDPETTIPELVDAAEAALAYDDAIRGCANNPERLTAFRTAQGDDLDSLYDDWICKSRAVLEKISR